MGPGGSSGEIEDPLVGEVLGQYCVVRRIGGGGMATVYEAEHVVRGHRVALKLLQSKFARHPDTMKRFQNEARAAANLAHPGIARCLDFGQIDAERPFLVYELLRGNDLLKELRRFKKLPIERAVRIALGVIDALSVAHRAGIVHRDVKPENIFLVPARDAPDQVKLLDFGVSKFLDSETGRMTHRGDRLGTAYYSAPEQLLDAGEVDGRCDVYALGAVLFEMIAGELPFHAKNDVALVEMIVTVPAPDLRTKRPEVPEGLAAAVARALEKAPDARFPTIDALADAIRPHGGVRPPSARTEPASAARATLPLIVLFAVGLVAIGSIVLWFLL